MWRTRLLVAVYLRSMRYENQIIVLNVNIFHSKFTSDSIAHMYFNEFFSGLPSKRISLSISWTVNCCRYWGALISNYILFWEAFLKADWFQDRNSFLQRIDLLWAVLSLWATRFLSLILTLSNDLDQRKTLEILASRKRLTKPFRGRCCCWKLFDFFNKSASIEVCQIRNWIASERNLWCTCLFGFSI